MQEYRKKILESGHLPSSASALPHHSSSSALHNNTVLIISTDEMKEIIKIVTTVKDSSLLPEGVSKTIQSEVKKQRGRFLSMLLGTLGANLLGDILTDKGINRAGEGHGQATVSAAFGSNSRSEKKNVFPQFIH